MLGSGYLKTKGLLPWRSYYFYLDREPWEADGIFIDHCLNVHFKGEFIKDRFPFSVVLVWVRNNDTKRLEECLDILRRRMLLRHGKKYRDATILLEAMATSR